jgi:pimeloyl-ACP methyl ester carboxylesterase
VDIHFIHVKSPHAGALPLIITHGWPGSVIEMLGVVGPLTDPAAHGGSAGDAFDLVIPSLPGYGFSGVPAEVGWNVGPFAQAWAELMHRLGYTRYVARGGDVGAAVTDAMGRQAPQGLAGIHMNLLATALGGGLMPAGTEQERAALEQTKAFRANGFGNFLEQSTRPQTIGYALLDSPVALAAWMLDHDTDAYEKITRAFVDGQPSGGLTRDHIPPPSPISTRPKGAAISPPGKSPNCSLRRSGRRSGRCDSRRHRRGPGNGSPGHRAGPGRAMRPAAAPGDDGVGGGEFQGAPGGLVRRRGHGGQRCGRPGRGPGRCAPYCA